MLIAHPPIGAFRLTFQVLVSGHLHGRQHSDQHAASAHLLQRISRDEEVDRREADMADVDLPRSHQRLHVGTMAAALRPTIGARLSLLHLFNLFCFLK